MVAIYHWVIDRDAPFDAITAILEYLWDAELTDYENGPLEGHVLEHLAKVANWLNSGAEWSPLDYVEARRAGLPAGWRASATHVKQDARPAPSSEEVLSIRKSFQGGKTLDVSEAAKVAGFAFPVAVTVAVWERFVEDKGALWCTGEEEALAYLLRVVADAYAKEGRDVYTWLFAEGAHGGPELANIKAIHRRDAARLAGLTIMMCWEDER